VPNVPKQACALLRQVLLAQGMHGACRAGQYQVQWQVAG
jgi:hypothetical protein